MEQWIPALIAAVLGGTGLVSLITGGAQLTARSRLKHRIETLKLAKSNATSEVAKLALTDAIDREGLRLASFSMVRLGQRLTSICVGIAVAAFSGLTYHVLTAPKGAIAELFVFQPLDEYEHFWWAGWLTIFALGVVGPLGFLAGASSGGRQGWVAGMINVMDVYNTKKRNPPSTESETPVECSPRS